MSRFVLFRILLIAVVLPALPLPIVRAAPPAAELLPPTTRGYLSIPNIEQLLEDWQKTQLGQLLDDPAMQPFRDDVLPQLRDQVSRANVRFAVTWEDLRSVAGGEICVAALEPAGRESHALALIVDITGREAAANQLLRDIHTRMQQRRAQHSVERLGGISVNAYRLAATGGKRRGHTAYIVIRNNQFLATDHPVVADAVAQRWQSNGHETLADLPAFQQVLARTAPNDGERAAHLQWYVEPLGMARVLRAAHGGRQKRGADTLQVLESQGFAALEGVGGHVTLNTGEHEILHRTFVAAPAPRKLAARMLEFPNGAALDPAAWVPANVSNYVALRWNMRGAFEHSKSLVNALAGEKFFDDFLDNLANDPNGPRVDLRRDLVGHLGQHITFISDCQKPITPDSERFLCAVEITNSDAVSLTVNRALQSDPAAKRHSFAGHTIWEISQELPEDDLLVKVEIQGAGFDFGLPAEEEVPEDSITTLPRSAVTVVDNRLIVASDVAYVKELLAARQKGSLADSEDYQRVAAALERLGAGQESFRVFSRSDESYHATYELLRANRADEANSLLNRLMKRLEVPAASVETPIDGSRLPKFSAVQKYLGPAGVFVESASDGWSITGCLLTK